MEGWQIGLIAVLVIGVAVIAFGALNDRRINERRRREMLAPPEREIPRFAPDSPTPNYLSDLQAHRPPENAKSTELPDEERANLRAAIQQPGVTTIDGGYASAYLVTDPPTGWSVLRHPNVLVSLEPVTAVRELLGVLDRQLPMNRPLVVLAPAISEELISTFEVNHVRQILTVLPVVTDDPQALTRIASTTGATPVTRADLQSGYAATTELGSCGIWIATPDRSYLLPDASQAAA
ncbi:MAG: hypothetical protein QM650_13935 [Microlunatus sp.]